MFSSESYLKYSQSKINGLKTPQMFHCYELIVVKFRNVYAKSFAHDMFMVPRTFLDRAPQCRVPSRRDKKSMTETLKNM